MIIYKITNLVNGKVYIGQTTKSLEKRKCQHLKKARQGAQTHLYQAIRKYGEENFNFEIICRAFDKETLNELETHYIELYDSIHSGYNMVDGGNNNIMDVPEVKDKHSITMRSIRVRNQISDSLKKYRQSHPFTEEHRQKLSEKAIGNHNFGNPDTRSIPCYCFDSNTNEYRHFPNYLSAGKWWYSIYGPFPYSSCVYQRKIKQSIQLGYCVYGKKKQRIDDVVWFREEVELDEVTDSKELSFNVQ